MARLGIPLHVRSLVLNRSPQSCGVTEAVYNRYAYDKEKREALMVWERQVAHLEPVWELDGGGPARDFSSSGRSQSDTSKNASPCPMWSSLMRSFAFQGRQNAYRGVWQSRVRPFFPSSGTHAGAVRPSIQMNRLML
jgi:hypothetical protein